LNRRATNAVHTSPTGMTMIVSAMRLITSAPTAVRMAMPWIPGVMVAVSPTPHSLNPSPPPVIGMICAICETAVIRAICTGVMWTPSIAKAAAYRSIQTSRSA
tara:strand:- start:1188 stop:1496 length:309 start_codon:yes stop_codon:yes gene_type:complete